MPTSKTLRVGSAQKRAAVLAAARELFLADGFDRSSVDAVAARAGVSKRTVYDYFGDKRSLLRAVVDAGDEHLLTTIRRTLDDALGHVVDTAEVEPALISFSLRISTEMLDSPEYATLQRLVRAEGGHLQHPNDRMLTSAPEEVIAERLARLADAGMLDISDARLAADHFIALAFGVTLSRLGSANSVQDPRVQPLITAGVRTFLRAYKAR